MLLPINIAVHTCISKCDMSLLPIPMLHNTDDEDSLPIPFNEHIIDDLLCLYHFARSHQDCGITRTFVVDAFVMHWYRELCWLVRNDADTVPPATDTHTLRTHDTHTDCHTQTLGALAVTFRRPNTTFP